MAGDKDGARRERGHVPVGDAQAAAPAKLGAAHVRSLSDSTSVRAIMTRHVACLAPEAGLQATTELFLDRDLSAAPVVDERYAPLAVMSKTDLLRFWAQRERVALPGALTSQLGTGPARGRAHKAAPVREGRERFSAREQAGSAGSATALTVGDVTRPYVLSLHEEAPISVAAALMAYENVHRLPIVSSGGEVVGVVSTLDIVRWLAQTTGMGAG